MKCLFLSLQRLLQLSAALRSKMTVFPSNMAAAARGRAKLLGLYGIVSDKEATALFSVHFAPSPPSLSAKCRVSLGLKVWGGFFVVFLIFMSMLFQSCVSGSHCLCLTGRLNVLAFLKTADAATGRHAEKRKKKKKKLFLWNGAERGRKKKKSSHRRAPSPLRW